MNDVSIFELIDYILNNSYIIIDGEDNYVTTLRYYDVTNMYITMFGGR